MREPRDTTGNPVGRRAFERGDRVWHMGIAEYGTVTRVASGDPSAWVDAKFTYIGGHDVVGSGGAQRMAIYGILVAVIALGTVGLRASPAETAESLERAEDVR